MFIIIDSLTNTETHRHKKSLIPSCGGILLVFLFCAHKNYFSKVGIMLYKLLCNLLFLSSIMFLFSHVILKCIYIILLSSYATINLTNYILNIQTVSNAHFYKQHWCVYLLYLSLLFLFICFFNICFQKWICWVRV